MNVMVILAIRPRCAGSIIREGRTVPMKPPKQNKYYGVKCTGFLPYELDAEIYGI